MKHSASMLKVFLVMMATMAAFTSCKKDDPNAGESRMMAVHVSPDAPPVDVLIDNVKKNTAPLAYKENTGYFTVASGSRNIKITAAGSTTPVIEGLIPLEPNKSYSVFAINRVSSIRAIAALDDLTAPASGKAHIRFFHLAPGANSLNVGTLAGSTYNALYSNRNFEDQLSMNAFSVFTPIDAGTYTFDVRVAGTSSSITAPKDITLQAGKIYTLYVRGLLGNASLPFELTTLLHN
jgi:hypothetical protein